MTHHHAQWAIASGWRMSTFCLAALLCTIAPREVGAQGPTGTPDAAVVQTVLATPAHLIPPAPGTSTEDGPPAAPTDLSITSAPWTSYRTLWFMYNGTDLEETELQKIGQVATYVAENPTAEVGINRPSDSTGFETNRDAVHTLRIDVVHAALVRAGVSDTRIRVDAFHDMPASLDRRVVVLVRIAR